MVPAGTPAASLMRWAARPVGAASVTRTFFARRIAHNARRIVVFPVPGPPVTIENFSDSAVFTAAACSGANANPGLVGRMVKRCFEAGASDVFVFDHTCDNWVNCYSTSGIKAAVEAEGGTMVSGAVVEDYREIDVPKAVRMKKPKVHRLILDCDVFFNVPVLKHHGGAKLTCAMKNYMGIVWDRRYFHQNDLHQCIADICTWEKKPVLNIVDAYRIMFQNGPQGRSLSDVATLKSLIVSPNIVAIDTAALSLFNQVKKLDLAAASHIGRGEANHLGTTDLKKLNIKRIKL